MDLTDQSLGFPVAANALADALELGVLPYIAAQSAIASYSRVGFEAAAVTGFAVAVSRPHMVRGLCRTALSGLGIPTPSSLSPWMTIGEVRFGVSNMDPGMACRSSQHG
jgi:hypothetical protein